MGQSQRTDSLEFSSVSQTTAQAATGAVTGRFGAIQILEDGTTFSDITRPNCSDDTIAEGLTYYRGDIIYGLCTTFTVSAGTAEGHVF